jgi:RNA polymerase subunit RPABC4/transcription elongation factor Spt4
MEDIRLPNLAAAFAVIALVLFMLLRAAGKVADESQICPVCGDRRDQAPVEPWNPGSRYCETCGRVTHREEAATSASH